MASGLFITGTGTGVGKTYVAALIARSLRRTGVRVGVYKPVASGCERRAGQLISPDALTLWEAAGRPGTPEQVCPQMFAAPLAPHLAAQAEGRRVDAALLREGIRYWKETSDVVIVEGAGGLMSPISDDDYNADLAAEFGYPLVVVTANELGTINATLQTLITARAFRKGIRYSTSHPAASMVASPSENAACPLVVAGIVLNSPRRNLDDPSVLTNAYELSRRCYLPLLATVEHGGELDCSVDWRLLAETTDRERQRG